MTGSRTLARVRFRPTEWESRDGRSAARPRNATVGFAGALAVTAAVFALFVLPGTQRPMYLYLALAFVLTVSLGGLLTALLTVVSAVRLARADTPE
ncbi:hypothetical protein ACFQH8_03115 [Halomicroarcula sp. GCM10025710]